MQLSLSKTKPLKSAQTVHVLVFYQNRQYMWDFTLDLGQKNHGVVLTKLFISGLIE